MRGTFAKPLWTTLSTPTHDLELLRLPPESLSQLTGKPQAIHKLLTPPYEYWSAR